MKLQNFIRIFAIVAVMLTCTIAVKGQVQVDNATDLAAAISSLQVTGGNIELTAAFTIAPEAEDIYKISTSGENVIININLKAFTLTLGGVGTVEIGKGIKILGITGKVVVTNGCIVNLTGDVESAVVGGHVFDVQNGVLNMLGGSITCTACSTNNAVLNLNTVNATANISGGSIKNTSSVAASRIVRNNAGTVSITGNPTLTSTAAAGGVLIQAAGKLYVSGSPTISATGTGGFAIMVQGANSRAFIGGTPTISGAGAYSIQNSDNTANYTTILSSVASNAITGSISAPGANNSIADLRAAAVTAAWDPASDNTQVILSYPPTAVAGVARGNLKIYYTTDNSTPTTASSSIDNNGSVAVSGSSWKIKAVLAEVSEYTDSTIYVIDNTNVSGKKYVANATQLLNAIAELSTTGGDIELKNNIDTTPGTGNTYTLASSGNKVNINTLGYSIKVTGPGTMEVGDSVRLYGTGNILINESDGVIRITGGEIESTPTSSNVRAVDANGGNLYITGGIISLSGGGGGGNPAAINVDNGYTAEISGGVIITDKANARTIRVSQTNNNFGVLKLSGTPTIKALGTGAHVILTQNGGKTIISGSPVILAEGTGNCLNISGNGTAESNTSYVAVLSTASPAFGGNDNDSVLLANTTNSAFVDFRGAAVVSDQASGSSFTNPTKVQFSVAGVQLRGAERAVRVFYTSDSSTPTITSGSITAGDSIIVSEDVDLKVLMGVSTAVDGSVQAFSYTIGNPDPTKYVSNATELAKALADLQSMGGDIVLTSNITIIPGKKDSVFRVSAQNEKTINIDAKTFSITIQGTGMASDNVALEIGNNVNLHGSSATIVANTQQGIIRIVDGASIISNPPASGSTYAVNANGGDLIMTGGVVKIENGSASGNPAAINVAAGYTATISGGTVSTDKDGARTVRVNGALNISGNPVISASGSAAYAIVSLNGGQVVIDGAAEIKSTGTGNSYGLYVQVSTGNNPTGAVIKRTANPTIQGTIQPVGISGNNTSYIDLRKFSIAADSITGYVFDVPGAVTFTAAIAPTSRQDTAMLGTVSWYYTVDGSKPTTASSAMPVAGRSVDVPVTTTFRVALGGSNFVDDSVYTFAYTVTHPLEGTLIRTYADLKTAFDNLASATSNDTSLWQLLANVTVPAGTADQLLAPADKPVKLNARGYRIMNGAGTSGVSQNIDLTFGGNIVMTSAVQGNFFQPGGTGTKLTINGGTYHLTDASHLIYVPAGQNVSDASTSWTVKNATVSCGGRAGDKGVANFQTVNGKSFAIDSTVVRVDSATGSIFYFAGQENVSMKYLSVIATNSSDNMGFVGQGGSAASGPATSTIFIDSSAMVADTGYVLKWPNAGVSGRTATAIIKNLEVTGKPGLLLKGAAAYNATFNLYDFRSYKVAPNLPKTAVDTTLLMPARIILSCTSSNADVAIPDILYTLSGADPTLTSTVYSGAILISHDTTLKVGIKTKETNSVMGDDVKTYKYKFVTRSLKVKVKDASGSDMPGMDLTVAAYGDITASTAKASVGEVDFSGLWSYENLRVIASTTATGYTLSPDTLKISSLLSDSTVHFTALKAHTVTVEMRDASENLLASPDFTVAMSGDVAASQVTSSGKTTFKVAEQSSVSFAAAATDYVVTPAQIALTSLSADTTIAFTAVLQTCNITVEIRDASSTLITSPNFTVSATGGLTASKTTENGVAIFADVPVRTQVTLSVTASGYTLTPATCNIASLSQDVLQVFTASLNTASDKSRQNEALTAYVVHNMLYVSDEVKSVRVVNRQGAIVLDQAFDIQSINVSHLPSGIYFVVLQGERGSSRTVKVIR
jgi:hypothetical protein